MKPTVLVLSCEHAGNDVPDEYWHLFSQQEAVLQTHRAFDIGACEIAEQLSQTFGCDYTKTTITRLLIDCNRSLTNPKCFSEFTRSLSKQDRQTIVEKYYLPFRQRTEQIIANHIHQGQQVLHLSIHSFTPELNGVLRNAAMSLLYDPKRHGEKEVARIWQNLLIHRPAAYRVRLNYPYQGTSDGFTTALRKQHHQKNYLGIEVESNQALMKNKETFNQLIHILTSSLQDLLQLL
ncbi:N-formylglutamate amidohydrolase [Legionella oakridgensis]|uniref:N-formylglutamate amidohydrolase n=2 Tax=Legionella oakridgensis TaxID=29423 RepID=A0A0W0XG65_9GAMM|nr:N-formylglutamate amidohydrolase [Legionella oakridgensis]AHE66017.1 putative N-formylglutamate amidohydrolase [Legionella oakridgensis ATCC 33761 = DSM 21215]ETO94249.1 putative N-formylglutamate amidohydrolase [Legionella oakridgensis RV-2-2007]KTD43574.1 N-formylglutamate amidohydrolase [Legionella oakridgensis]STY15943.1 N-formylglutamate amidohydrolase [Legionella longbeachae]